MFVVGPVAAAVLDACCEATIACSQVQFSMAWKQHFLSVEDQYWFLAEPCLLHPTHCHLARCVGLYFDIHSLAQTAPGTTLGLHRRQARRLSKPTRSHDAQLRGPIVILVLQVDSFPSVHTRAQPILRKRVRINHTAHSELKGFATLRLGRSRSAMPNVSSAAPKKPVTALSLQPHLAFPTTAGNCPQCGSIHGAMMSWAVRKHLSPV
jgi:hypothetical protein